MAAPSPVRAFGNRPPPWIRIRSATQGPGAESYRAIKDVMRGLALHTVCEEAQCPNAAECWGGGTATFMVMGDTCTRGCRFCAVKTARTPPPVDIDEPAKLVEAVRAMKLRYVVVTSVDRDDLPDQGAGHFAACIRALRESDPDLLVEVLIPDFQGDPDLVRLIVEAGPHVLAHNVETVPRLTPVVRDPRAGFEQSLKVLAHAKALGQKVTKSAIIAGFGETDEEVVDTMKALRAVDCDILTIGQYLRPSAWHVPVAQWVEPAVFDRYRIQGEALGFRYVASGPLVRSSYRAGELFVESLLRKGGSVVQGDDAGEAPAAP
ncbi:MAG: lipoyl synthase [Thermoplasmatota archaeon]